MVADKGVYIVKFSIIYTAWTMAGTSWACRVESEMLLITLISFFVFICIQGKTITYFIINLSYYLGLRFKFVKCSDM